MRFILRPERHGKALVRGISRRRIGRRDSIFPNSPGMNGGALRRGRAFFGSGPRTTTRAAGGRFRVIAGRDRTERSFMRFERRYPEAAEPSLPHPLRSRTNSASESGWTWTRPPRRRRTRLPTPRSPCRRFSAGAASSFTDMSSKKLSAVQGRRISLAPRRVERDGLLLGAKGARGLLPEILTVLGARRGKAPRRPI